MGEVGIVLLDNIELGIRIRFVGFLRYRVYIEYRVG